MPGTTRLAFDSKGLLGSLTDPLARMFPDFLALHLDRDLARCGFRTPNSRSSYLAFRNLLVALVVLVTASVAVYVEETPHNITWVIGCGLLACLLAYCLPRIVISTVGEWRARRVVAHLPEALDLLRLALSAGLPLQQALERTVDELRGLGNEIAWEFELVTRQAATSSLEYAFQRLSQRIETEELLRLADAIRIANQAGTPPRSMLEKHASQTRELRRLQIQQRANSLSLRLLFPTVLCLAPAAFIVILGPPVLELRAFRDRENRANGLLRQQAPASTRPLPSSRSR